MGPSTACNNGKMLSLCMKVGTHYSCTEKFEKLAKIINHLDERGAKQEEFITLFMACYETSSGILPLPVKTTKRELTKAIVL